MTTSREIQIFFDGACPLCAREIAFVKRFDSKSRIALVDIAAPDFDAASYGKTHADLMARIQARLPDGRFIEGVEVFRRMYAAIGLGPLVAVSRLPGIARLLDASYRWFAANRLRLTGRCDDRACRVPSATPR